ncbi:MAG: hypothetical protein OER90_02105 [Gemmatimonadota bacterium]|nr:hypothetical protein [Gemmatimonadota bacterium]
MAKKLTRQPKSRAAESSEDGVNPGAHLEQVRNILFGENLRTYEERLARLEKHLMQEHGELRDATDARFDALESHLRQELGAVSTRLEGEGVTRTETLKSLTREFRETLKTLEKRVDKLDDGTSKMGTDLRQHTAEQIKALSVQLREQSNTLSTLLERKFEELRTEKADRMSLAAVFAEMATRLSDKKDSSK